MKNEGYDETTQKQNLKRLLFAFSARRQSVSICLSFFVWQWFSHVGGSFQREVFWLKLIYNEKVVMMKNDCELVVDASGENDEALISFTYTIYA